MRQPGNEFRVNPHKTLKSSAIEGNSQEYLDSVHFKVWLQNTKFTNAIKFCSKKYPDPTAVESSTIDNCMHKYNMANHLYYDEAASFQSTI